MLDLVARHADVWNTPGSEGLEADIGSSRILDDHCRELGRDPAAIRRSAFLPRGSLDEVCGLAERYAAAGFSELILDVSGDTATPVGSVLTNQDVTDMSISADGNRIATVYPGDNGITVREAADVASARTLRTDSYPVAVDIATDGTIYFKDQAGVLYALNATGTLKWSRTVGGDTYASPSIAPDGTVYIGATTTGLSAYTTAGFKKWGYLVDSDIYTSAAIDAIAALKLVKVASLQMSEVRPAAHMASVDLSQLISDLRERLRRASSPPPAPVATPVATPVAASATASAPSPAPGSTAQFVAILAAPGIELRTEALRLLEPLFGVSATRKIDEFARIHPPGERPQEFLLQCQQHVSVMLGASKAEALFRPLYDRLESERLHRRG